MLNQDSDFHDPDFLDACRTYQGLASVSVRCMGVYEPDELQSRLHGVDAVVMASRWYENSPMVIQEAFSHGVPVIAPDYGGMAEKIDHGTNGLLYGDGEYLSLLDSLSWLMQNEHLLPVLKQKALDTPPLFGNILYSHLDLYNQIISV